MLSMPNSFSFVNNLMSKKNGVAFCHSETHHFNRFIVKMKIKKYCKRDFRFIQNYIQLRISDFHET